MSTDKERTAPSTISSNISGSFVESSGFKFSKDDLPSGKVRFKKGTSKQKASESHGTKPSSPTSRSSSSPGLDDSTLRHFPDSNVSSMSMDTVPCKHCKKPILRPAIREHQASCLKAKQEKARRKKEAKEEKARAKQNADKGGGDADADGNAEDDSEIKVDSLKPGAARKSSVKNSTNAGDDSTTKKASKKRKADAAADGDDAPGGEKKQKKKLKKDEPKPPKAPKPKGPVDVERQCGVTLPNGGQCARSLTCKSHSMGAKRAVPGRSLPYDVLLQQYQKKNQARQQKAALESNAPLFDEDDPDGVGGGAGAGAGAMLVDSESEKEAVMTGILRGMRGGVGIGAGSGCRPIVTQTRAPMRRKYQLVRMKETLSNALSGNKALFNVGSGESGGGGGGLASATTTASTAASASATATMRGALAAVSAGGGGGGAMDSGAKTMGNALSAAAV